MHLAEEKEVHRAQDQAEGFPGTRPRYYQEWSIGMADDGPLRLIEAWIFLEDVGGYGQSRPSLRKLKLFSVETIR